MSQAETAQTHSPEEHKTGSPTNLAQVAPQQEVKAKKEKGKKQVDPEYVKSPVTIPSDTSRPASTGSIKPFQKGGFLSLLLCCTVGGASFLDNSDGSSSVANSKKSNNRRNNSKEKSAQKQQQQQQQKNTNNNSNSNNDDADLNTPPSPTNNNNNTTTTTTTPPPPIITNPTDLEVISSSANNEEQQPDTLESARPISLPPQTSPEGPTIWLLPPLADEDKERKCLVLDLDETLVHSSFKIIPNPDFIVPVEIDNQYHNVYVLKRPGVDEFMRKMGEKYEIVVFTASLAKYADPVLDMLDIHRVVKHRLFRESCFNHKGTYVKDLSQLGRDLASTLILDNSPASYIFHTSNAIPVSTWFNDPHDTELTDLVAFLDDLTVVHDVQLVLDNTISAN